MSSKNTFEKEHDPCQGCVVYEGYNGGTRCHTCEITRLREENQRLKEQLKASKINYGDSIFFSPPKN